MQLAPAAPHKGLPVGNWYRLCFFLLVFKGKLNPVISPPAFRNIFRPPVLFYLVICLGNESSNLAFFTDIPNPFKNPIYPKRSITGDKSFIEQYLFYNYE